MMRAGALQNLITIKQQVPILDEYNRPTKVTDGSDWQAVPGASTHWAEIDPLQGREIERAHEVAPTATHKITMRYAAGITNEMRVYCDGEVFEINAILDPKKRHISLLLYVTENPGAS